MSREDAVRAVVSRVPAAARRHRRPAHAHRRRRVAGPVNDVCVCGHKAIHHGPCVCREPRPCIDHLGTCTWCGCSIFEETHA